MKTKVWMTAAAFVCCCVVTLTSCSKTDNPVTPGGDDEPESTVRVLTFEDQDYKAGDNLVGKRNWTSLVDDAQYGGSLLYESDDEEYYWNDENNTFLAFHTVFYPFWSGGQAISNYVETDITKADYTLQLAVPTNGGHNGSKNFCVHFGYSGYTGPTGLPAIYFMDGVERVIDHMYVVNTSYTLNSLKNGDGFSQPLPADGWFKIIATGYDANDNVTGTAEFFLAKDGNIVDDWTLFSLAGLGKVLKVSFDVDGTDKGDWGLNTPGYFAYDDVTVRFE